MLFRSNGKKWLSGAEIRRKVDYRWSWKFRRVVEPVPGLDCDVWYICQNLQSYTSKRVINWAELTFPELIPSKLVLTSLHSAPQPADGAVLLCTCVSHLSSWHLFPSIGSPTTLNDDGGSFLVLYLGF